MKILLSAFACKPNSGSETGVGWRWALELAKQHKVVVVTDESRRHAIEAAMLARPIQNLTFVYYRPFVVSRVPLNSKSAHLIYMCWQFGVVWLARSLHLHYDFDLVQHLTYGVFRHPSFLGFVGPPFVFGPVGGGEMAPWALTQSMPLSEKVKEYGRFAANLFAKFDPFLWLALSRTTLILAKTPETIQALPLVFRHRSVVQLEIGIDPRAMSVKTRSFPKLGQPFRVLFAGRLLGLKGIHLALRAVGKVVALGYTVRFIVVGEGPMRKYLIDLADQLKIGYCVEWIGHIPQNDLFSLYESVDCLLFPSLHDSSGNVVLEAMSFGLPVVCLDLGGPGTIADKSCGLIVSTSSRGEEDVADGLQKAIIRLIEQPGLCADLSQGAEKRSSTMTWSAQVAATMNLINQRIQGSAIEHP